MANSMLVGQWIAVVNSLYSLLLMCRGFFIYFETVEGELSCLLWIAAYAANIILNTFLFRRLLKRDRSIIWLWTFLTIIFLLVRIGCIDYYPYHPAYKALNVTINFYIAFSLLIMIEVYKTLKEAKPDQTTDPTKTYETHEAIAMPPLQAETSISVLTDLEVQVQSSPLLYGLLEEYLPSAPELPSAHIPETSLYPNHK